MYCAASPDSKELWLEVLGGSTVHFQNRFYYYIYHCIRTSLHDYKLLQTNCLLQPTLKHQTRPIASGPQGVLQKQHCLHSDQSRPQAIMYRVKLYYVCLQPLCLPLLRFGTVIILKQWNTGFVSSKLTLSDCTLNTSERHGVLWT